MDKLTTIQNKIYEMQQEIPDSSIVIQVSRITMAMRNYITAITVTTAVMPEIQAKLALLNRPTRTTPKP